MSLLKNYSIICDTKGNYIMDFNTSENASATYKQEADSTQVITLTPDSRGTTAFNHNFGNASKNFKFAFDQLDTNTRGSRVPSGGITGG